MQIINEPQNALSQATQGIQWAYPNLTWVPNTFGCYDSNFQDDQIPLIAGGGSGHDPAHWGYVGPGMLTAAIMGTVFQPPTSQEIVKVTKQVTRQRRVFFIGQIARNNLNEFNDVN
ncbi:dihydroxyacetone kinase subunit DhaK [Lactiplantibacillus plantarum]|uniref:dihydroxyacetone kinase subunit DhaK n=1 Tax=Lactiplantibacillus plantarum TaxID=1590 RepID=UPI0022E58BB3|nr:dihydroxyacetone kinase subunit DhaK [Lactiplantibacillus plantarum]